MQALDTAQLVALAGALGWASGVRLYLVVLLTGLAGYLGWVNLPQGLHPDQVAAAECGAVSTDATSRGGVRVRF